MIPLESHENPIFGDNISNYHGYIYSAVGKELYQLLMGFWWHLQWNIMVSPWFLQKVSLLRTFAARTARILRFMLQPCSYPAKLYQKIWDPWIEKYHGFREFLQETIIFHGKKTRVLHVFPVPCRLSMFFFTPIHRQSSIGPPSQLESLLNCLHLGIKSWVSSFSDTLTHPNILSLINLFVYYSLTHTPNYTIKFVVPANILQE